MPNVSNVHKSEFQKLLEQAMSQTPDIGTVAECKGSETKTALASVAGQATCISSIENIEKFGDRQYGYR